jgi:ABC-type oligopeptide transport system substrate-binding subunit
MKQTKQSHWLIGIGLVVLTMCLFQCEKRSSTPANSTSPRAVTSFVHPGVLNTQASLDLVGGQVNGGDPVRTASYQKVLDFINSHTYPTSFPSTVVVGSNGATSPSKAQIRSDAELVYALALRWAKTGHSEYATQAIGILNGWA